MLAAPSTSRQEVDTAFGLVSVIVAPLAAIAGVAASFGLLPDAVSWFPIVGVVQALVAALIGIGWQRSSAGRLLWLGLGLSAGTLLVLADWMLSPADFSFWGPFGII